jgi:hypothetical protein
MGDNSLLKRIIEESTSIMPSTSWNQQGFAFPVASERLLLNKEDDGNPMASVLASVGEDTDTRRYSVFDNAFDCANDDRKPFARFKEPVHDHLVYFGKRLAALSKDNQTILNINGRRVAKFRQPVHPQILEMPDNSYVALALNCLEVIGTNKNTYPAFEAPVNPTLIYEGDNVFAAIRRDDGLCSVVSNAKMKLLGAFPLINGDYPQIGVDELGEGNGRIVKVGGKYAGIDWKDKKLILHTINEGENHIPYGKFPVEINPQTLITEEKFFIAVDSTAHSRVYALYLDKGPGEQSDLRQEGIDTSQHVVVIPYNALEKILK